MVACGLVIVGHCEAAIGVDPAFSGRAFQLVLNATAHCAVPLFFVLAGYSLAVKLARRDAIRQAAGYTRRILALFVTASVVYIVLGSLANTGPSTPFPAAFRAELARVFADPVALALTGPAIHLWFLPALVVALWATVWFRRGARLRYLAAIGVVFYAVSLLAGSYRETVFGLPWFAPWSSTLLLGTPFVVLGILLRYAYRLPSSGAAVALFVAGTLCHAGEQYVLWSLWNISPFTLGPMVGTALQTLGVAWLALQPRDTLATRALGRLGQWTLMAYLSHMAFLAMLRPYRVAFDRPTWRILFPLGVAVLAFSFAAAYQAASRYLRLHVRRRRAPAESLGV